MITPIVGKPTYADIANMLNGNTIIRGIVKELNLIGEEINADTVEKAFMDNRRIKRKTSEEVLSEIRTTLSKTVKRMQLPLDTTLEELGLKTLARRLELELNNIKNIKKI